MLSFFWCVETRISLLFCHTIDFFKKKRYLKYHQPVFSLFGSLIYFFFFWCLEQFSQTNFRAFKLEKKSQKCLGGFSGEFKNLGNFQKMNITEKRENS